MPNINDILCYESGSMDEPNIIRFFQEMIDDGTVWGLQGSYGRMAKLLIENGECSPPRPKHNIEEAAPNA